MKLKQLRDEKKKQVGKEGSETSGKEKGYSDPSELTEAELDKYWRL